MVNLEIATQCEGLSREEQESFLRLYAPDLTIWSESLGEHLLSAFLIVAPWSRLDNRALTNYLAMSGDRGIALFDWFPTKEALKHACGYEGSCLQSPILVIRHPNGAVEWSGEGSRARQELQRRASCA